VREGGGKKNNINRLSNPSFFSALGKDRTTKIRRKLQNCTVNTFAKQDV